MPTEPQPRPSNCAAACGTFPPCFEPQLAEGSACPLPEDGHTEHLTTTPDGRIWRWDGWTCAYPDDCTWDGDGDCCVSFGEVTDVAVQRASR